MDVVYIATPHPLHADAAIFAAHCGKHILCEKPLAVTAARAMEVVQAVRASGVFLMEAFMYRFHPQIEKVIGLIKDGAIGQLRSIDAEFGFHTPFVRDSRFYSRELGGGGILDVGCYPVSMSRLLAGAATGLPFANPVKVAGLARLNAETGVDEYAAATLLFPGGILARIACAISLRLENRVNVLGEEGSIEIHEPWIPAPRGGVSTITLRGKSAEKVLSIESGEYLYAREADAVGNAILAGRMESDVISLSDTLGNMQTLDAWREAVGVFHP